MSKEKIAVILMILCTFGVVVLVLGAEKYRRDVYFTETLIARAPENGNWYPRQIHAKQGEEVRLLIRNIETVTHGFAIPDLMVAEQEIKAGTVKVLKFTPKQKGTFPFMCTVWCSANHMNMKGELIVE